MAQGTPPMLTAAAAVPKPADWAGSDRLRSTNHVAVLSVAEKMVVVSGLTEEGAGAGPAPNNVTAA